MQSIALVDICLNEYLAGNIGFASFGPVVVGTLSANWFKVTTNYSNDKNFEAAIEFKNCFGVLNLESFDIKLPFATKVRLILQSILSTCFAGWFCVHAWQFVLCQSNYLSSASFHPSMDQNTCCLVDFDAS